jgi:hypothetical protein
MCFSPLLSSSTTCPCMTDPWRNSRLSIMRTLLSLQDVMNEKIEKLVLSTYGAWCENRCGQVIGELLRMS